MNKKQKIQSGDNYNIKVSGNFYYRVNTMFMRLRQGELYPEQLTDQGWVKC